MKWVLAIFAFLLTGCTAPFPEKFNDYNFISSGKISSKTYEVVKVFNTWKGTTIADGIIHLEAVLYDVVKEQVIFYTSVRGYEKRADELMPTAPYRILYKINQDGVLIDSVKLDYSVSIHNSGMLYNNDNFYYIDWLNSGDKTQKEYTRIINDENLTLQDLDKMIEKAISFDVTKDYDHGMANIHLKNDSGIMLIRSKKLYQNIEGSYGVIRQPRLKPYKDHYTPRFIKINVSYETPKSRTVQGFTYSLDTELFVKKKKQSTSLGNINGNGRSGWTGMGYFALKHSSEFIQFKGYAFNGHLDRHHMYYPIEKNKQLAVLHLLRRTSDLRPPEAAGVYVIRKKTVPLN